MNCSLQDINYFGLLLLLEALLLKANLFRRFKKYPFFFLQIFHVGENKILCI